MIRVGQVFKDKKSLFRALKDMGYEQAEIELSPHPQGIDFLEAFSPKTWKGLSLDLIRRGRRGYEVETVAIYEEPEWSKEALKEDFAILKKIKC